MVLLKSVEITNQINLIILHSSGTIQKFFEPVPMVNVFHSRHNPTEIGFSNFPT